MDVDDVIADLTGEWLRRYNLRTGDNVLPEDIKSWDIAEFCTKMSKEEFFKILKEPDFYDHVLPIVGARKMIYELLARGHRVVYISSCVGNTVGDKKNWLVRYGLLTPKNKHRDFIAANDKSLVTGVDMLFDDRPHNVETFPKLAFLVNRPHNRESQGFRRVDLSFIPYAVELTEKIGPHWSVFRSPYRDA